ncbi:MAG: ABC transporter ATP-binding protein [Lachnospiraceae bacterium]|nr:ABC transporter ATP-binding protein [Lachnospiraceae bacterium]
MIEARNLSYKEKKSKNDFSIDNVCFKLEDGYIMSLLGKNGSGKTTLLNLIYGMLKSDSGEVLWNGEVVNGDNGYDFKCDVAYVGGEDWCFLSKSINDNVEILKCLYEDFNVELYEEYLKYFDLKESDRTKEYSKLSTGQMMLFQIAFAMARKPKLLIMDEPMANLDPVVKVDIVELLQQKVAKDNMSVIISTHLLSEISDVTDYIGIIENGKMTEFDNREVIFDKYNAEELREIFIETEE